MRVGLLAHSARSGDAIGRQIAAKVRLFQDRGCDVRLIVAADGDIDPRIRPQTIRHSNQNDQAAVAWLKGCDLVVVEYSQHSPVLDLLPAATDRSRIMFDYHGVTPPAHGAAGHRDALARGEEYRRFVWFADLAIVHSEFARNELQSSTRFPAERILQLGYPVESVVDAPNGSTRDLRTQLGLAADSKILLFVGRLAPNKCVSTLIQSLEHLPPITHAVVIGECGHAYEAERQRCRELAARLGLTPRVHFLGTVDDAELSAAYRSADALVIPSVHEGFCLPVIEAMSAGLPVIAARAGALPETLGDAGITFESRNAADLASRVLRVLAPRSGGAVRRIAIAAQQFGSGFVGGAEQSLRMLARRLMKAGYSVEAFSFGPGDEQTEIDGIPLHRFRADPGDADRRAAAAHAIQLANGRVDAEVETEFLAEFPHSDRLIEAIRSRGPYDAVVTGPYLSGLSHDVARAFPDRAVLAPCWHDEPTARLQAWREAYRDVAGVLYHSPEEQLFAQTALGFNHPNSQVLGALVSPETPGDAANGRKVVSGGRRYLLFAGRRCREKGFDRLLRFFERYAEAHPGRFTLALTGGGSELNASSANVRDLGYVTDDVMADVMAGAVALVHLSPNESLSLAVLQAQAHGVPVIVAAGNAVLEGHLRRGGGGLAVGDYETFAAALDDLWHDPDHWRALGRRGREYVETRFDDVAEYDRRWRYVIDGVTEPLSGLMKLNGQRRAAAFTSEIWRTGWENAIDLADSRLSAISESGVAVVSRLAAIEAERGAGETSLPLRLTVQGSRPIPRDGAGCWEIVCRVSSENRFTADFQAVTRLPGILVPGETVSAMARVPVPADCGDFNVTVTVRQPIGIARNSSASLTIPMTVSPLPRSTMPAVVTERLRTLLAGAEGAQRLPDGYIDVSLGRFAKFKRWIKHKVLHNFKTGYVDVMSRQQSEFNRLVLAALAELSDVQTALLNSLNDSAPARDVRRLQQRQRKLERLLRDGQDDNATLVREEAA